VRQDRPVIPTPGLVLVAGVPAHPLLVHAVVVLLPLAALGAVAVAVRPGWSRPYGPLVALAALGGAASATLATVTGRQLEAAIGVTPQFAPVIDAHEQLGDLTLWVSWPFAALAVATVVLSYRTTREEGGGGGTATRTRTGTRVLGAVTAVVGVVAVVLVVLTGHSGAAAVWGGFAG
jgi:hypothetical protein